MRAMHLNRPKSSKYCGPTLKIKTYCLLVVVSWAVFSARQDLSASHVLATFSRMRWAQTSVPGQGLPEVDTVYVGIYIRTS